jgi:hypothetical protein
MQNICSKVKIEFSINNNPTNEWFKDSTAWNVTLFYKNRKLTTPFYTGASIKEPTAADVLHCLISDAQSVGFSNGFEDWATSLGYDPDSRKAEKIYNDCVASSTKVRKLLGKDFDAFAKACEDF